jgi:lipopolysaccharide/colanic/teichoic acid biosynthesis glycosyltransferase
MTNQATGGNSSVSHENNHVSLLSLIAHPSTLRTSANDHGVHIRKSITSATQGRPIPCWKRAIDVAFCLAVLPLFALLALVMAVVMKIASPGPILFRQERIGYLGRRFMCYKFRTMIVGANSKPHQKYCENLIDSNAPMAKLDDKRDPRVIPGGWLLRASGMDELPQIINVIKGDMSLVGPRPCVTYEYEKFLPWQQERFSAMPGLTGLWQVSGKNQITYEQMLRMDVRYVQTISWWLDCKIMFLTAPTLFGQIVNTYRARKILAKNTSEQSPVMVPQGVDDGPLLEPARAAA